MLKKINYLFALCIFTLFLWQCKKSASAVDYDRYPVQIFANVFVDGVELNWSQVKSSDFIQYRIWRSLSSDTIPDKINMGNNANNFVVASITDLERLNFKDISSSSFNTTDKIYYRVETVLKNRSIWSRNLLVLTAENEITSNISSVAFDKEKQLIFLLEFATGKIFVFDSNKKKVIKTINTSFSVNASNLIIGKRAEKTELYVAQEGILHVISTENLSLIESIDLNQGGVVNFKNISTDENGKIFISRDDNKLVVVNRENNAIVISDLSTFTPQNCQLYTIPNNKSLFFVQNSYPYRIGILTMDDTKMKVKEVENERDLSNTVASVYDISRNFVLSADQFIVSGRGLIFDRNLNPLSRLMMGINSSSSSNLFKDIKLIDNDNFVSIGNNFSTNLIINRWRMPSVNLKEVLVSNGSTPIAIVPFSDKTWAVYYTPASGKTTISQIKI